MYYNFSFLSASRLNYELPGLEPWPKSYVGGLFYYFTSLKLRTIFRKFFNENIPIKKFVVSTYIDSSIAKSGSINYMLSFY